MAENWGEGSLGKQHPLRGVQPSVAASLSTNLLPSPLHTLPSVLLPSPHMAGNSPVMDFSGLKSIFLECKPSWKGFQE